jgi:predicted dehydrogenase
LGLPVVAGFDPNPEAVAQFREDEPGATVPGSLDALLTDPAVEVIDLAAPHHNHLRGPVMEQLAAAGKPVLVQKPLAEDYATALAYVEAADRHGTVMAMNQSMAHSANARALIEAVVADQVIGVPRHGGVTLRMLFDPSPDSWEGKVERWWTAGLTVHTLNLLQAMFGSPETVYAVTGCDLSQAAVAYDGFGDTSGIIRQTLAEASDDGPLAGLGLGMAEFQRAIIEGRTPAYTIRDNLGVCATVEAIYRSSAENRVIHLNEAAQDN